MNCICKGSDLMTNFMVELYEDIYLDKTKSK